MSSNGEDSYIPMALDLGTAPGPSPMALNHHFDSQGEIVKAQVTDSKPGSRDYFDAKTSNTPIHKLNQSFEISQGSPRSGSPRGSRHSSQPSSPHIAYQEIGRDPSFDIAENARKRRDQGVTNSSIAAIANEKPRDTSGEQSGSRLNGEVRNGKFILQEVPKNKKNGGSARSSKSDGTSPMLDTSLGSSQTRSAPASAVAHVKEQQVSLPSNDSPSSLRQDGINGSPHTAQDSRSNGSGAADSPTSYTSPLSTQLHTLPQRHDSLARNATGKNARRELGAGSAGKISTNNLVNIDDEEKPMSAPPAIGTHHAATGGGTVNGNRAIPRQMDSPSSGSTTEIPPPPPRAQTRTGLADVSSTDSFVTPRQPPNPPTGALKARNGSVSTLKSESTRNGDQPSSPKLPRYHAGGDFSMEEDMVRILGNDEHQDHSSFLRRVSNSVRHARSYSDRGTRLSKEPKWPKSPLISDKGSSREMSSPTSSSPEAREELVLFKNELRRIRQNLDEKDHRIQELESALEAKNSINQMNTELREKRSTMVFLDTQKEIVIRELEVLTEHIAASKKSGEPLDLGKMSNLVLREFAESLQKLKDSFAPQIEDLTQKKIELIDEVANLTQLKEKSFQEFEQLSLKNAQLADLNNQLVHQIQELYRANAGPSLEVRPPNGLGIYTTPQKERFNALDGRDMPPSIAESDRSGSTAAQEHDAHSATFVAAPQVIKVPARKFNWKKGGQNVAKGVTKGIKGAFTSNDPTKLHREGQYTEGTPYGSLPQSQDYPVSSLPKSHSHDPSRQGFGFFGAPKPKPQYWKPASNGSTPNVHGDGAPGKASSSPAFVLLANIDLALFGSELEVRADYERVGIPGIVMRCIQEVELRGNIPRSSNTAARRLTGISRHGRRGHLPKIWWQLTNQEYSGRLRTHQRL